MNNDAVIVDPSGKPARASLEPLRCPDCGRPCPRGDASARCLSGGFGAVTDLCVHCGHNFGELTLPLKGK